MRHVDADQRLSAQVVKCALARNAAALFSCTTIHHGWRAMPREVMTRALRQAVSLVDIKVLDHFMSLVAAPRAMAERGLV